MAGRAIMLKLLKNSILLIRLDLLFSLYDLILRLRFFVVVERFEGIFVLFVSLRL